MLLLRELRTRFQNGEKFEFIFFWSGIYSQWYRAKFKIKGVTYNCAEQFMMAEKAKFFGDEDARKAIMRASHPKIQKSLGRTIQNFDDAKWNNVKTEIVVEGNVAKFSQNKSLLDALLATENKILVEASPEDSIWGIGLTADHPSASDPPNWKGQNLLGFCLVEARKRLRK